MTRQKPSNPLESFTPPSRRLRSIYLLASLLPPNRRISFTAACSSQLTKKVLSYILVSVINKSSPHIMHIHTFNHSTTNIPNMPGTYWVKAKTLTGKTVVIHTAHGLDIRREVEIANKSQWLDNDLEGFWVEVLLNEEISLTA